MRIFTGLGLIASSALASSYWNEPRDFNVTMMKYTKSSNSFSPPMETGGLWGERFVMTFDSTLNCSRTEYYRMCDAVPFVRWNHNYDDCNEYGEWDSVANTTFEGRLSEFYSKIAYGRENVTFKDSVSVPDWDSSIGNS